MRTSTLSATRSDHDDFEQWFWGTCTNTLGEELKQVEYGRLMGMELKTEDGGQWRKYYDAQGRSIIDVGGGPVSMLLKVMNWSGRLSVVDPGIYPDWVRTRYDCASIDYYVEPAETFQTDYIYDEALSYNVLQHVSDPLAVVRTMQRSARLIRFFDWIEYPPELGHPNELHADELDQWFGAEGSVGRITGDFTLEALERDEAPRQRKDYRGGIGEGGLLVYYGTFVT
jgi:hypothetical protein